MKKQATSLKTQVVELIATHPKDTFTVPDIEKQLTGKVNIQTLRVLISRTLKNEGLVKKSGQRGHFSVYEITKSGRSISHGPSEIKHKKAAKKAGEVNLLQIGQSIVITINDLRQRIGELSQAYSDIQSELNREKAAYKIAIKERDKKNTELLETITSLRNANRKLRDKLEAGGSTFKLDELLHTS